jgi:hypothetical protein
MPFVSITLDAAVLAVGTDQVKAPVAKLRAARIIKRYRLRECHVQIAKGAGDQ